MIGIMLLIILANAKAELKCVLLSPCVLPIKPPAPAVIRVERKKKMAQKIQVVGRLRFALRSNKNISVNIS